MKIRTGFVSNSSSSSFLIYGVALDRSEILDLLKKGKESEAEAKDAEDEEEDYEDEDYESVYDALEEALKDTALEYHTPYDEQAYIGTSWDGVGDDETGKQFKARVESELAKVFGKEQDCSTLSEAWHD